MVTLTKGKVELRWSSILIAYRLYVGLASPFLNKQPMLNCFYVNFFEGKNLEIIPYGG